MLHAALHSPIQHLFTVAFHAQEMLLDHEHENHQRKVNPLQIANVESLEAHLADLEKQSLQDNIWNDQSFAQSLMQQIANLREQIAEVHGLSSTLGEIDAAAEVASMEVLHM